MMGMFMRLDCKDYLTWSVCWRVGFGCAGQAG